MNEPKRHHWWPQLQSRHWTNSAGCICATRADGTSFAANPSKIGVESELYVRFGTNGEKDFEIEKWFSRDIETPFAQALDDFTSTQSLRRERFLPDADKAKLIEQLGYLVVPYRESVAMSPKVRDVVSNYVAALLVRNPSYLAKMTQFHMKENFTTPLAQVNTMSLDNMLIVFQQYRNVIEQSEFILVRREGDHEFLFSDAGITTQEPWRTGPIPFDIHFPLTPDLALEVLPVPKPQTLDRIHIMRAKNSGVGRLNRIALGSAQRFIFSRKTLPPAYVRKFFGVSAPKPYGFRLVNGRLETKYDATRDD